MNGCDTKMTSDLYKRTLYLNKDIDYLIGEEIIEYDLQEGGFNLCKYFKLLSDEQMRELLPLDKEHRHIKLGLYQRDNKEFASKLNECFMMARKMFFEANEIEDNSVLAIKKDAMFIRNKRCKFTQFDNLNFRAKNCYSSYLYINKIEFYFNDDKVDIKQLGDKAIELHKDYMIDFLSTFIKICEKGSRINSIKYLTDFIKYYRHRDLDIGYYRELNKSSKYAIMDIDGKGIGYSNIVGNENLLNIVYNYKMILVPLVSMIL